MTKTCWLRFLPLLLIAFTCALPAAAQHTVFYSDFRQLGRLDSPPMSGELEPQVSTMTTSPLSSLARLPNGDLLQVGGEIHQVDTESLELTEIRDIDFYCADVTADAESNLWCVHDSSLHCLNAGDYELAISVVHPGLSFRGIAALGPRLYAIAYLNDNYPAGPQLLEVNSSTGGISLRGSMSLPEPPQDGRFFDVAGMDFDAAGDLWLGLELYWPSVILPFPPDGYLTRVLDPLGGAVVRPAQAIVGTGTPSPLIIGAPTVIAVPAVGAAGLATLAALLVLSALALLGRRP